MLAVSSHSSPSVVHVEPKVRTSSAICIEADEADEAVGYHVLSDTEEGAEAMAVYPLLTQALLGPDDGVQECKAARMIDSTPNSAITTTTTTTPTTIPTKFGAVVPDGTLPIVSGPCDVGKNVNAEALLVGHGIEGESGMEDGAPCSQDWQDVADALLS